MTNNKASKKEVGARPDGMSTAAILTLAGGCAAVAKECGITRRAPYFWTDSIPRRHVETVARMARLPLATVRQEFKGAPNGRA